MSTALGINNLGQSCGF